MDVIRLCDLRRLSHVRVCMIQLDEEGVKEMFGDFGKVVSVTIVKDNLNRSKGFGFVEVSTAS